MVLRGVLLHPIFKGGLGPGERSSRRDVALADSAAHIYRRVRRSLAFPAYRRFAADAQCGRIPMGGT
eukprot:15440714-Alexandrium_andersonii.AAC.1